MEKNQTAALILVVLIAFLLLISCITAPKRSTYEREYSSRYSSTSGYHSRSTPRPTAQPAPRSTARPSTGGASLDLGPSTDGFYHPEDFYEWNRDNFSDYEEAEDYYYEHGGY